jgi:hypothetical protein
MGGTHWPFLLHTPEAQSPLAPHAEPFPHPGAHVAAEHMPPVQTPEAQSLASTQNPPGMHAGAQDGEHAICTFVTDMPASVPVAFMTEHDCAGALGCVTIITPYPVPSGCAGNVKLFAPFAIASMLPAEAIVRPLPTSPEIVPPTV